MNPGKAGEGGDESMTGAAAEGGARNEGGAPTTGGTRNDGGASVEAGGAGDAGGFAEGGTAGDNRTAGGGGVAGVGGSLSTGGLTGEGGGAAANAGVSGSGGSGEPPVEVCERPGPAAPDGVCTGGATQAIAGGEACNGEDDNCNGQSDEGLADFQCGIGACSTTVMSCGCGSVRACVPKLPTASSDGCNGVDDDCDGAVDEDCAPCIRVSPTGNDSAAATSNGVSAFARVQAAVDFADTHRDVSTRVCVAAGATCGATATYAGPPAADLTMRNGISVYANYESTTWMRCGDSTTTLAPQTGSGVLFPAAVASPTILDGFSIARFGAEHSAGVTVNAARAVVLSNLTISGGPAVVTSVGVRLVNGADATIYRSQIDAGAGTTEAIGVSAVSSRVSIEDACASPPDPVTGRCSAQCAASGPSIRGKTAASTGLFYAIVLDGARGSRIERSLVCTAPANSSEWDYRPATTGGVLVRGDARDVVIRANSIESTTREAVSPAVDFQSCAGEKPWVVDNQVLRAVGRAERGIGVRASGDCHPVLDSNETVTADITLATPLWVTAIECALADAVSSRCVISGNRDIYATGSVTPMNQDDPRLSGYGVSCSDGACSKISNNRITGLKNPSFPFSSRFKVHVPTGVSLEGGRPFVDRNRIAAGCSSGSGTGLFAFDSGARIQNNEIVGTDELCEGVLQPAVHSRSTQGLRVVVTASGAEIDVNSNLILAGGTGSTESTCESTAISFGGSGTLAGPVGIFRNNYAYGGFCSSSWPPGTQYAFREVGVNPRIFEHNMLNVGGADPNDNMPVYLDGGTARSSTELDDLSPTISSGNGGSACMAPSPIPSLPLCTLNAGTPVGAPLWDLHGNPRDASPDIGPVETQPAVQ
jgi:hypothetical protein